MIQSLRRLLLTVLILLLASPSLKAFQGESAEESKEIPIDVVGKVQDHHYLDIAGYHMPLPRIIFVEGSYVPYWFWSTEAAVESGLFVEDESHNLLPAGSEQVVLDMSITSHLMYVWFGVGLTFLLTIAMARRYSRGVGRKTEPKGWFQNLFEITFVFVRDDIAKTISRTTSTASLSPTCSACLWRSPS